MTVLFSDKKNYIFDLYGTLLDIHTDETMPPLWQWLAGRCATAGAYYASPGTIRETYIRTVRAMENALGAELHTPWPEIELRDVFRALCCPGQPASSEDTGLPGQTPGSDGALFSGQTPGSDGTLFSGRPAGSENTGLPGQTPGSEDTGLPGCPTVAGYAGSPVSDEWIEETAVQFRQRSRLRFRLFDDTLPVLKELRRRGKRIYMLSNAQACFTLPEISETGISRYFDRILISSNRHIKKPDPGFMGMLIREEHLCPEDCVMIGNDYDSDIASAAQWNMDSIFLNTDGYTQEDRAGRLERMCQKFGCAGYRPAVIPSGRLGEIFSPLLPDPEINDD